MNSSTAGSLARRRFRRVPASCAVAVLVIGAIVLTGWATHQTPLMSVIPGMITMKVNTAVALMGLAGALFGLNRRGAAWRWMVWAGSFLAAALAVAILAEYAFDVDLKIDNLLFHDAVSPRYPGRPAPATLISLIGLAAAFALLHGRWAVVVAQVLLFLVMAMPLAMLGGYLYGAPGMYQNAPYPVIALNTSCALILLCIGGLFARPRAGLMGVVMSRSLAGSVGRKLLPAAVAVPLATGLLVLAGGRGGLYTPAFGSALLVAFCALFFAGVVCWTVTLLWRTEMSRAGAERERERSFIAEKEARIEAEHANRMKDEFLAVVSHELRTPLNAILGWSQVLGPETTPDELALGLQVIARNARSQTQIIEDILDMGRIMTGKVRLDVQRVDLVRVIEAAIDSMRPAADAKGVSLLPTLDARHSALTGDPDRLQQVFWNLLSNAIKFTPRGGRVRVTLERVQSHIEVVTTDTGEGIESKFLPHVFDRFCQADSSMTRRHGGLGLGLSIVKQLVELHGGSVRAASPGPGQGTTVVVALPISAVNLPAPMPAPARHASAHASPHGNTNIDGLRVLVVDDEPDARDLVRRLLEGVRAVVTTAGSAREGFDLVASQSFDVLVSDIGMPGEDGYAFLKRVRALGIDCGGSIPAIALTAYARSADRVKAIAAGFQSHVAKPVEPVELLTRVAGAAGRQSLS